MIVHLRGLENAQMLPQTWYPQTRGRPRLLLLSDGAITGAPMYVHRIGCQFESSLPSMPRGEKSSYVGEGGFVQAHTTHVSSLHYSLTRICLILTIIINRHSVEEADLEEGVHWKKVNPVMDETWVHDALRAQHLV